MTSTGAFSFVSNLCQIWANFSTKGGEEGDICNSFHNKDKIFKKRRKREECSVREMY